ncbi:MAG: DUF6036 family nucleotidyltransferase [Thermoleophilaceae bacterium]
MRRADLEHLIRASAHIADDEDIVVVGSQAVLGAHPAAPASLLTSADADVYPRAHPERADVIEGAIGEGSPFHATFGYYAHGVGPETAKAPAGWEDRLVAVSGPRTAGATGWCLETHDLVLSKCVAGRTKDWGFAREALRHGLVDARELRLRVEHLEVDEDRRAAVERELGAMGV